MRLLEQYILDYFDVRLCLIPKMATKAIFELRTRKLLKGKKNSFEFTLAGTASLTPAKIEKRRRSFASLRREL
jgi:hypothetical protein